jgi:Co/Zn/Cd efflux system component
VLLDSEMDHPVTNEIRAALTSEDGHETQISDLHVWRVGKNRFACIVSLVTHDLGLTPSDVKRRLQEHSELVHITVEIHRCTNA